MNKIILIIAISMIVLGGTAEAKQLDTPANTARIHRYTPEVDVSRLTEQQILVVLQLISSSDDIWEARGRIRAFLN